MRCQAGTCRNVFIIGEQHPTPAAEPASGDRRQQSGSVGNMVPLVPVEDAGPPDPPASVPHVSDVLELLPAEQAEPYPLVRSWEDGPPPPRSRPAPTTPVPAPVEEDKETPGKQTKARTRGGPTELKPEEPRRASESKPPGPRVLESGIWAAPPVRRGKEGEPPAPHTEREPSGEPSSDIPLEPVARHRATEEVAPEDEVHQPRGKWAVYVVIPLVLCAVGVIGGGSYFIFQHFRQTEEKLAADADRAFQAKTFNTAAQIYDKLLKKDSEQQPFYEFRRDLSQLRYRLVEPPRPEDAVPT